MSTTCSPGETGRLTGESPPNDNACVQINMCTGRELIIVKAVGSHYSDIGCSNVGSKINVETDH